MIMATEIEIVEYTLDGLSIDMNKNVLDFKMKDDAISAFLHFVPMEEGEQLVTFVYDGVGYIFAGDATLRYPIEWLMI